MKRKRNIVISSFSSLTRVPSMLPPFNFNFSFTPTVVTHEVGIGETQVMDLVNWEREVIQIINYDQTEESETSGKI